VQTIAINTTGATMRTTVPARIDSATVLASVQGKARPRRPDGRP
jgi:hypothetical protein